MVATVRPIRDETPTLPGHEQLQQLLEGAEIGIAQIDADGRYLLASDCYCEMVGRSRDELLRTRLHDCVHSEDLPNSLDGFIRVLETAQPGVIEHRLLRPDGSVIWIRNNVSSTRAMDGKPQNLLVLTQDITAQKRIERALAKTQADLRMVIDSAAESIYCVNRNGKLTLCNVPFLRMFGFERQEDVLGRDIHEIIHHSRPDGTPLPKGDSPVYRTARSGVHAHLLDTVYFRRDGTPIPVECWVRPIIRDSEIQGAICTLVDITERKQAEARQQLLTHEMAHRVKNTLAMVQAIVGQSLRSSPADRDIIKAISHRLIALGNAHTALTRTRWGNASLIEIVESAVAIHQTQNRRIRISGPKLEVGAKAALAITLALHELCTNAAKYGALSTDSGTVVVEWVVAGGAADARLQVSWKESGGPPVTPPSHRGFGSRLVAESVGLDLKGESALLFEPTGVAWRLNVPLNTVRE